MSDRRIPTCSEWARAENVDPIGSAGSVGGYVVVDWPLPWPSDIEAIDQLADVLAMARNVNARLQLTAPASTDRLRISVYMRPRGDAFRAFAHGAMDVPRDASAISEAVAALLSTAPLEELPGRSIEVLLCTHGRRDRCCGSRGMDLWIRTVGTLEGVEVRRTSHLGGHRFAPTAVVLPFGSVWGNLDDGTLTQVATNTGNVSTAAGHYRGCSGLSGPDTQAVERAVFMHVGWSLFDMTRSATKESNGKLVFSVRDGSHTHSVWEATVEAGRSLPIPDCGRLAADASKEERERIVTRLSRVE